jgi:multidrug efflux pump subunit AcrA (membrane-fusion protein)
MVIKMNVDSVRKRGWVKNGTIIFLIILVGLLFLSNTIMNHGLPEVAAQYTTSGTITARIRGSGTVSAIESYEVIHPRTQTVNEVRVRSGDEVEAGDVLIVLAGVGSEELDRARDELHELELRYEIELIESPGGSESVSSASRNVQRARNTLADTQRTLAGIHFSEPSFYTAQAANNSAQATVNSATGVATARAFELAVAQAELDALGPPPNEGGTADPNVYAEAMQRVANARHANDMAQASLNLAQSNASIAASEFSRLDADRMAWLSATTAVRDAQLNLDEANAALNSAQRSDNLDTSLSAIELRELRRQVEEKRDEVEQLENEGIISEITSAVSGVVASVSISPGNPTPVDTPLMVIEVVDRGYTLSFPVTREQAAGVNVGDNAEVDRGWWSWGEEISAILTNIRNDPQNPIMGRLLEFTIRGDVESGTQLNVTLNQRSENFQIVVPNAAVRTDTNGDFVLVVVSRSSPLGNRFIATRTDVNILASDDTHSAITGALTGWDFVITHSNRPVEHGMQVQLTDNP